MNFADRLAETVALLDEPARPPTAAERAEHRRLIDLQIERELLGETEQAALPLLDAA